MIGESFATGSRVYGTSRPDSDWDIVVRTDIGEIPGFECTTASTYFGNDMESASGRCGAINFIFIFTDARFEMWRKGTEFLKAHGPVTRDQAVRTFERLFTLVDVEPTLAPAIAPYRVSWTVTPWDVAPSSLRGRR